MNYNLGKERKVLIFFDDMIADMISLVKFTLVIILLGEELEKKKFKNNWGSMKKLVDNLKILTPSEQQEPKFIEGIFLKSLQNNEIKKN